MTSRIAILDYGMGNLRSVQKALQHRGHAAQITGDPDAVLSFDRLILPGVGNFADGMRELAERGLIEPVKRFAQSGRPMLGVCLGMQLMLDSSTEDAPDPSRPLRGLSLLPGRVVRFSEDQGAGQPRLKVPHMGWNQIEFPEDRVPPLFKGVSAGSHVYFVHGYYCQPADANDVAAITDYGQPFASALHRDNLWATQFHPEKSQDVGLRILDNFASH